MPIEAYIKFDVDYQLGKSATLKVFRIERTSITHSYDLRDIVQKVTSHVSQNYGLITIPEIIEFIKNSLEDVIAVEVFSLGAGFTVYFESQ